ncbi:MAG: diacylglycerol kinase family protein [Flavisolibacter sp.]|jgi:diacylglycerol kinase|nr:diacylglycerol kinase family protein [Flavisolibacter sp.]
MIRKPFSWKERYNSFGYAWQGIKALFRTEHNAWIHTAIAIAVVIAAILLKVSSTEAIVLVSAIAFVFVTEILNTAIEKLADFISLQKHPQIGLVKDLAAAAVLIAAIAAVVIGAIIFIPKLF